MTKNLLLVTNDTNLSSIMKQGVEQAGYHLHMAKRISEAVVLIDREDCSLVFLDLDLGTHLIIDIGRAVRAIRPAIDLILFSNSDTTPLLDEIRPWALLRKPSHVPELLHMLNNNSFQQSQDPQASGNSHSVHLTDGNNELAWLQDVTKAAQHLTRLTLESSAQAALITRKKDLWAYAGQLSQDAAKELAMTVTRHWDGQKGSDLLRFVRLEATKAEHMLYATRLADDVVLALVFDAETPFSTIRNQAGQLVSRLSSPGITEAMAPVDRQEQAPVENEATIEFTIDDVQDPDADIPDIASILSDIPSPVPPVHSEPIGTRPSQPTPREYSREEAPTMNVDSPLSYSYGNQSNEQTVEHVVEDFDATMPSKSQRRPETPIRRPGTGELDETRPHSITEVVGRVMLEPVTAGLYNLTYACLLVPRFTSHYLTGDISDRLSEWLPQICVAFGWRLEYLAVRPDYMQWVLNVPPATSPGYLMRVMRQQTSEKVFAEFPRMAKENPSGDFWAPGYLIMGGTQPHPPALVKDYIKQTRKRQGIQ